MSWGQLGDCRCPSLAAVAVEAEEETAEEETEDMRPLLMLVGSSKSTGGMGHVRQTTPLLLGDCRAPLLWPQYEYYAHMGGVPVKVHAPRPRPPPPRSSGTIDD